MGPLSALGEIARLLFLIVGEVSRGFSILAQNRRESGILQGDADRVRRELRGVLR